MAAAKHFLGLHKKEERQKAYALVRHVYQRALHVDSPPEYNYALGYVQAIGDLLAAEAPHDTELLGLIGNMQNELLDRGATAIE